MSNPSGPSQPTQQSGLNQSDNAASKTNTEQATSQTADSSASTEQRKDQDVPSTHDKDAQPSALGSGDTGPLKERSIPASDAEHTSDNPHLDGEQMRAPGEGDVAQAVKQGGGGGHAEEADLMGNMDQKAQEHDAELKKRGQRTGKEIEEEEKEDWTGKKADVDVSEALSGRGTGVVLATEG